MAKEIRRRFDLAGRQVVVDIEDDFGTISHHSISLVSHLCPHCGQAMPGTTGSADVNASALRLVSHIDAITVEAIEKMEAAAQGDPELLKVVQAAKAKRNGNPPSSNS